MSWTPVRLPVCWFSSGPLGCSQRSVVADEAGPVKFPSIPGSRQKPLALASVVVIVGGVTWWVIQRGSRTRYQWGKDHDGYRAVGERQTACLAHPGEELHPRRENLSVSAEVYDSLGQQLGGGQCALTWSDPLEQVDCDNTLLVSTVSLSSSFAARRPSDCGEGAGPRGPPHRNRHGIGIGQRSPLSHAAMRDGSARIFSTCRGQTNGYVIRRELDLSNGS